MTRLGRRFYIQCAASFAMTLFLLWASQFERAWWFSGSVAWVRFALLICYVGAIIGFCKTWLEVYFEKEEA